MEKESRLSRRAIVPDLNNNTPTSKTESCIGHSGSEDDIEDMLEDPQGRQFEPIHSGDREKLHRLASQLSRQESARLVPQHSYISKNSTDEGNFLERKDTLAGVELGDPVLDPTHEKFDVYKWARYLVRSMDEEGYKQRRAGITFKNLNISGSGSALNLQKNVGSLLLAPLRPREYFNFGRSHEKQILRNFDGLLKSGELLVVLGRPGSGCSTLLKTICGELHGLEMGKDSTLHYNGITQQQMLKEFRGEVVYNQEVDKHFPHLTVGQTLEFAASARTPHNRVQGSGRNEYSKHMAQVVMTVFGLSHTYNTKVGNDFIRLVQPVPLCE